MRGSMPINARPDMIADSAGNLGQPASQGSLLSPLQGSVAFSFLTPGGALLARGYYLAAAAAAAVLRFDSRECGWIADQLPERRPHRCWPDVRDYGADLPRRGERNAPMARWKFACTSCDAQDGTCLFAEEDWPR